MTEREELEKAMAALDQQRTVLGDAAVEAALAGLQKKLSELDKGEPASPALAGERRVLTVLFCDVKGSTAMAEKLDPEEWAGIMKRAMMFLIPPVTRHDGMVARLMGDAVLAFFGTPTTHEDDPQRAVRAGLEIIEGISVFRQQLQRERGLDFNVRVGINTGLVFVGAIGADQHVEYTAVGDTMNLAARMEQSARPGSVQITEQTYRLVEPWFEFECLGGIDVKGRSEPAVAYRVLRVKAKPMSGRGLEGHGLSAPLVGREHELNTLRSSIERLYVQSEGGIVGIIGEAGLGKSRLVAEAKASAANRIDLIWLEGPTLSFGQTISYWPFQQILRGWAGITEEDDPDVIWSKLEDHVRELFGEETISYLPYLASLLALEVRGEYAERVKYLDGDAMGKQIFLTTRRFFGRLALSQPTVLVFEDIHWMDASSAALLEHLLPLVGMLPLLILGLSRPGRNNAARLRELCVRDFTDRYIEIRLAPLSDLESARLIHNLLETDNLPSRLRELIVEKADGNPFFLEEVLRTLIDTGAVARDPSGSGDRWRVTARVETIHIPDTIQGVIMARVDRLDEEVKRVLRMASVIGRSFLYRVLKTISEASQQLDDSLFELQQTELIHEKQSLPELEYIFRHALAQEATYESILLQKRRELHSRVARAIELLFGERLEEFYGLLAYHYSKAEAWDKAQEYLLKAGDQAGRIAADAEALSLYQQAMSAYARAFGDKWDPLQRAALERKMGEAFLRRGEYPLALERFSIALAYLGYRLPMSRGQVRWALLQEMLVQAGHRLRRRSLKPGAAPLRPGTEDEVFIYAHTGFIDAFTNAERFLMLAYRMLNVSEQRSYATGFVIGSCQLGIALDFLPIHKLAGSYHRAGALTAEALGIPYALGAAYVGLQVHEFYIGELDQSLEHGRRTIQIYRQAGDLEEWGFSTTFYIYGCLQLCRFDEAFESTQELIRVGQDARLRALWCWGEAALGQLLRRQGKLEEAIAALQKAQDLAKAIPDYIFQTVAGVELGQSYLKQGNWQAALTELETTQRVAQEHQVVEPQTRMNLLNTLAALSLYMFEHSAGSERAAWSHKARRACQVAVKTSSVCRTKAPEAMRLQGTYEWLNGRHSAAHNWWHKALAEAGRMSLRYDMGMIHAEMGMRRRERAHLDTAEALLAEIGAELDLATVREFLKGMTKR